MRLVHILIFLVLCSIARGQVPTVISYQGRLTKAGTNAEGTALFKCALVNSNGTVTFWSNDGTSTNGLEPATAVTVPLAQGLFTVLLGDTTLSNMTALPATVFQNSHVSLRLWAGDTNSSFTQMVPDQRITSVGFALMAASVPQDSITDAQLSSEAGISGMKVVPNFGSQDIVTSGTIDGRMLNASSAPSTCSAATAGRIYFNTALRKLFYCDGTAWVQLATVSNGDGSSADNAATSCKAIKNAFPGSASGIYWLDPDGIGGISPFQCYCDMSAEGGGWTLWGSVVGGSSASAGLILTTGTNYMDHTRYAALLNTATDFKATGATSGNQFFLSRAEAATATCHTLTSSVPRFASPLLPMTWGHREGIGCDANGSDFSVLGIRDTGAFYIQGTAGLPLWHQNNPTGPTIFNITSTESRVWLWLR